MKKKFLLLSLLLMGALPWKVAWKSLDKHGAKTAKEHHLTYLNLGIGHLIETQSCRYAYSFTSDKRMTLEEGKVHVKSVIEDVTHFYMTDSKVKLDYEESVKNGHMKGEMQPSQIGFKISFWDENVDRPLYPHLAQIKFTGDQVLFYYADPKTQALQDPITCSLDEVLQP